MMMRLARQFLKKGRRTLILAALPVIATGAMLAASAVPAAASALPVPATHAAPNAPAASATCVSGYFCFWVNAGYVGARGQLAGNNSNWTVFAQSQCKGGTWNDCASAGYNDGSSGDGVIVYQNAGFGGGAFCFPQFSVAPNFTQYEFSNGAGLNDAVSSNQWVGASVC